MYRRAKVTARSIVFVLAACAAFASRAHAQASPERGSIEGRTIDSVTSGPREGVAVTIDGTGRGMLTDSVGGFSFAELAAGTYTLRTRQIGTRSAERQVVVRGGAVTTVTFRIVNAAVTLAAVRARAPTPERDRFELSPSIGAISITANNAKNVPAFGEPDVLRAVQLLPGVNARNDFSSGFNVRGGESDQNLILLDGYPIYNPFHLGGLFSTFLEETVGSIDLLTGGFGAAHGGRLSSVLDVTSADPARGGIHGTATVSVISSSLTLGSAGVDGRSGWTVSGRRTYADKLVAALSDRTFPYHFSDAQFHGVRALNGGDLRLEVTAYGGTDALDGDFATFGDSAKAGAGGGTFNFGWQNQVLGTTLRNVWRDGVRVPLLGLADSVRVAQHLSFTRFATALDLGAGAFGLTNSVRELRASGDVEWHRGTRERMIGYDVSRYGINYDVNSSATESALFALAQSPVSSAVYYQERWKPTKRLIAEAGLRAEHFNSRSWSGLEPRVAVKYFVTPDLALTAAVGQYAQWMHSLNREDIPVRIFDFWISSDPYIPISTARHYILGAEKWLGPLRFARLEAWTKQYEHLLEQNTADDPAVRGDEFLESTGTSYGFDLLLRQLDIGPLGGWLAYTYGVSARARNGVGYWPGHDRRHNLNLVGTWRPGAHYTFSARLGVASGTPFTDIVGQIVRRTYDPRTHSFDDASLTEREPLGGARNSSRYPLFQRLDVGVSRAGEWRGMRLTPYLGIVNAYNASNVFIYTFDYTKNPPTRESQSQFPFLPSIGLTVAF
ncbi:MAG: TonB-dependent receptor [Gemmatimonadota bacterium]|nr:TonB-dependent receptor [Gemmatimonadota bacterium]